MSKSVAVVETYEQAVQDVIAQAEMTFQKNAATYRRLVAEMGKAGGKLPQDDATELMAVCEALGIPPERLGEDASAVAQAEDLTAKIQATEHRNAARVAPLPGLRAAWDEAQAEWLRISGDCEERLRVAQAALTEKRRAYEKLAGSRNESTEQQERDLIKLRDSHPHLFGQVTRERLAWAVGDKRSRHVW